jgi:hypothetical protein
MELLTLALVIKRRLSPGITGKPAKKIVELIKNRGVARATVIGELAGQLP